MSKIQILSRGISNKHYINIHNVFFSHSFKERGACYALLMLSDEHKRRGVISASLGNHAQALCYHGKRLNIPVTVVMPTLAPIIKIEACRNFGATVIVQGNNMKESKHIALHLSKERNIVYINGFVRTLLKLYQQSYKLKHAHRNNGVLTHSEKID